MYLISVWIPIAYLLISDVSSFQPVSDEDIFRMMFEAQDRFRNDNTQKQPRNFKDDWERCDEKYKKPQCCTWSDKKSYARGTWMCNHIKGDIVLDNDKDAHIFQSLLNIREIQGSLTIRNTSLIAFGMPRLQRMGFSNKNPNKAKAVLIIENNKFLRYLRIRKLAEMRKHPSQKFAIFKGNPNLIFDSKQWHRFNDSCNGCKDFDQFLPYKRRYFRSTFTELYPYFLFAAMIMVIFTHHFIMLEVNGFKVRRSEKEMLECLEKMRNSTLAAELLLQTPSNVELSFDTDVLHLCKDQEELVQQIQKILDEKVKAFNDSTLDEVTPRDDEAEAETNKIPEAPKDKVPDKKVE